MAAGNWSHLHDIGLIYLTCMHGADDELDSAEYDLVKDLLKRRLGAALGDVGKILDEAMLMYVSQSAYEMVNSSIASLSDDATRDEQISILKDLADLVAVDGVVYPGEVHFIASVAREWGLEDYLAGDRPTAS